MSYNNRAYMHGYCSTCAFMHNFTSTDVSFFLVKMCISRHFFYFALIDASALIQIFLVMGVGGDQEIIIGNRDGEND